MLKLCAGYSISPYAACHLNGHARVRNTAWIIIKASVNGLNGVFSSPMPVAASTLSGKQRPSDGGTSARRVGHPPAGSPQRRVHWSVSVDE